MHERTLTTKTAFRGRLLRVDVLSVELETGLRSTREIVRHPGAVVVLAQLPDKRFVLVRQFRKAIERDLIEAVAGTREPGEGPALCARRELREETGYAAATLTPLGIVYPAPGYTEEKLYMYFARLEAKRRPLSSDEDEKLENVYLTAREFERRIARGLIQDAKTLAVWLLYRRRIAGSAGKGGAR